MDGGMTEREEGVRGVWVERRMAEERMGNDDDWVEKKMDGGKEDGWRGG